MIVQKLSSEAKVSAMNFTRDDPREFAKYSYDKISLENDNEQCTQFSKKSEATVQRCSEKVKKCSENVQKNLQSNFIEITLWYWCSPVNLLHIFKTSFYKVTSGQLLLKKQYDTLAFKKVLLQSHLDELSGLNLQFVTPLSLTNSEKEQFHSQLKKFGIVKLEKFIQIKERNSTKIIIGRFIMESDERTNGAKLFLRLNTKILRKMYFALRFRLKVILKTLSDILNY